MVLTRGMVNTSLPILEELLSNTKNLDEEAELNVSTICIELKKLSANFPLIDLSNLELHIYSIIKQFDLSLFDKKNSDVRINELQSDILILTTLLEQEKHKRRLELDSSFQELDTVNEKNDAISKVNNTMSCKITELRSKLETVSYECESFKLLVEDSNSTINHLKSSVKFLQNEKSELCNVVTKLKSRISSCNEDRWLDDAILQTFYTSFNDSDKAVSTKSLLLGPTVTELLKHGSKDDVAQQLRDISLSNYSYIFFCLGNSSNDPWHFKDGEPVNYDGGSHWSLLFYVTSTQSVFHIDSLANSNLESAKRLLFNINVDVGRLFEVPCPQQNNYFECGLNVLMYSKLILSSFCTDTQKYSNICFLEWFKQFNNVRTPVMESHITDKVPGVASSSEMSGADNSTLSLHSNNTCNKWITVNNRKCNSKNSITYKHKLPRIMCSIPIERISISNKFAPVSALGNKNNCKLATKMCTPQTHKKKYLKKKKDKSNNVYQRLNSNNFIVSVRPNNVTSHNECPYKVSDSILEPSKPRVKLFADSHGRGISSIVLGKVSCQAVVTGWVKPGAKIEQLLGSVVLESDGLCSRDIIVILGGTNDIVDGRCGGFEVELRRVLRGVTSPRVLLVGLPSRHDRPSLNRTVSEVNGRLRRLADQFDNVTFVSLESLSRPLFTRHGMHLNNAGKHVLADILLSHTDLSFCNRNLTKCFQSQTNFSTSHTGPLPFKTRKHAQKRLPVGQSQSEPPCRTFTNKSFLGEATKPVGVPWVKYLGSLGITSPPFLK